MSHQLRVGIAWTLFACAIIGAFWAAKLSPSYGKCDGHYKQDPAYHESANSKQERIRRFVLCEGEFFDANKEGLTAAATIAIAGFTLVLWLATSRQAKLTRQTVIIADQQTKISRRLADIAHQQFVADHRPLIRARYVEYTLTDDGREGQLIGARIHYKNIGATKAHVRLIHARIFRGYVATPADLMKYPDTRDRIDRELETGEEVSNYVNSEFRDLGECRRIAVAERQGIPLDLIFLIARIGYFDVRGVSRETGFLRKLDLISQQWLPAPDYHNLNYED